LIRHLWRVLGSQLSALSRQLSERRRGIALFQQPGKAKARREGRASQACGLLNVAQHAGGAYPSTIKIGAVGCDWLGCGNRIELANCFS
jgi:hypothetical protein